jgi:hypothetical protein
MSSSCTAICCWRRWKKLNEMVIRRQQQSGFEFTDIEPIEADLLRQVPVVCESGEHSRAEERLFSKPADASESQFLNDWDEYVRPELRHLFLSAKNTVGEDLAKMSSSPGKLGRLMVPRAHADSWLNALNQARLILAAKFNFTARELSMHESPKWFSRRDMVLQQINFYAEIQERIIDVMTDE